MTEEAPWLSAFSSSSTAPIPTGSPPLAAALAYELEAPQHRFASWHV